MKFYQNWKACIKGEEFFPATVPGNVQMDYAAHIGILDNIQFSKNVAELEKVENSTWEYVTQLDFEKENDEQVWFIAEGIDYSFDILIDGVKLFSQEGMYTPVKLDITDIAKVGSELKVVIHPHPKASGGVARTRTEAAQSCKPPVHYEWDWNPRLLISGFWLPAFIETRKKDYIRSCEAFYELSLDTRTAKVHFEIDADEPVIITLTDPFNNVVYEGTQTDFSIKNVELWWCNGQGEPNLYTWTATTRSDMKTGEIGFRTIKLVQNTGTEGEPKSFPKGQYASPITIELNGRRIFCKGSNFVNADIFNANTTKEQNLELVMAAKKANMNIFRMWGGAGLAKPEFYEYCNIYGILVWQEFPLACNNYVATPHYLDVLKQEATSIVKTLRHHPCIALWCGGNELFNGWSMMTDQSLALRLLDKICYEEDPNTAFIMTSPRVGMAHGGYVFREEDGKEVYGIFQNAHNTAYTEFGVPSIAPVEQLRKIIPEDELFPMKPTDAWVWHHGFEAWGSQRWACLDVLNHYFKEFDSIEEVVECSQWLQCEGYKAIFEEGRRQWPYCSMTINWCFNEPWITAANNSIISYPNLKKPAYYAVKDSLRPVMASARFKKFTWNNGELLSFELWYHNDSPNKASDTIVASVELGDKTYELLTWKTDVVQSNQNKMGPTVNFILPNDATADYLNIRLVCRSTGEETNYKLLYRSYSRTTKIRRLND